MRLTLGGAAIALALTGATLMASPASAQYWHDGWHGGGGRFGPATGFAAGALVGSALGQPYYDDYDGPYAYGGPEYAYAEGAAVDDGSIAYCQQRFRSYDPTSGTYLGYDGAPHPCP